MKKKLPTAFRLTKAYFPAFGIHQLKSNKLQHIQTFFCHTIPPQPNPTQSLTMSQLFAEMSGQPACLIKFGTEDDMACLSELEQLLSSDTSCVSSGEADSAAATPNPPPLTEFYYNNTSISRPHPQPEAALKDRSYSKRIIIIIIM